jgi:hypothetical protein
MNLHTERISDNASEPSEGTSIIVCSNNRYCQLNDQHNLQNQITGLCLPFPIVSQARSYPGCAG